MIGSRINRRDKIENEINRRQIELERLNERENELRGLFHTYNKYIDNFFTEHKKEERSKRMVNLNDQISNELDLMLEYSRLDHSIKNNNLLSGYKTLSSLSRSDVINLALADFVFRFYEENDVKIYDYYRKYDRLEGECDEMTKQAKNYINTNET